MKKALKNRIDLENDVDEEPDTRSTLVRFPRVTDSKIFQGWGVKI